MGIDNKPIEYTLATVGACLWMLVVRFTHTWSEGPELIPFDQIIPQLIKSYREKSTQGLSPHLMSCVSCLFVRPDIADRYYRLWASSSLFYGTYTVASEMNIALQVSMVAPSLPGLSWSL